MLIIDFTKVKVVEQNTPNEFSRSQDCVRRAVTTEIRNLFRTFTQLESEWEVQKCSSLQEILRVIIETVN